MTTPKTPQDQIRDAAANDFANNYGHGTQQDYVKVFLRVAYSAGFNAGSSWMLAAVLRELRKDGGLTSMLCFDFLSERFKDTRPKEEQGGLNSG